MKIVVFGLAISSSWGNGHATLWRGLCRALAARGHLVVFFERDMPYYASHRDMWELPGGRLHLYSSWDDTAVIRSRELADADAAIVTSFCPDANAAEEAIVESSVLRVFYDLDTPVTLERLAHGETVPYISSRRSRRSANSSARATRFLSTAASTRRCISRRRPSTSFARISRISGRMPPIARPRSSDCFTDRHVRCRIGDSCSAGRSTRSISRGRRTSTSSAICLHRSTLRSTALHE
jgi:hypothetical protein